MKNAKEHTLLYACMLLSTLLTVLFLFLKSRDYLFLNLDAKWLLVAGIPILFALFAGKYIKSFEGFGIKLEANLKETSAASLITKFGIEEEYRFSIQKDSIILLNNMSSAEKRRTYRLRFTIGTDHYYDINDIRTYLRDLPNLKFVEIVNRQDQFLCLLPISFLKSKSDNNYDEIAKFIEALYSNRVLFEYPMAIKDFILRRDNVIEAYKKILNSYSNMVVAPEKYCLPVLNDSNIMTGVVFKSQLERKIAEEVIKTMN